MIIYTNGLNIFTIQLTTPHTFNNAARDCAPDGETINCAHDLDAVTRRIRRSQTLTGVFGLPALYEESLTDDLDKLGTYLTELFTTWHSTYLRADQSNGIMEHPEFRYMVNDATLANHIESWVAFLTTAKDSITILQVTSFDLKWNPIDRLSLAGVHGAVVELDATFCTPSLDGANHLDMYELQLPTLTNSDGFQNGHVYIDNFCGYRDNVISRSEIHKFHRIDRLFWFVTQNIAHQEDCVPDTLILPKLAVVGHRYVSVNGSHDIDLGISA